MKNIHTDKAPKAVGPYSQAIIADNFIFCSGQIGIDAATGRLVESIENQVHHVMKNISAVLAASGSSIKKVVKTTIFLADINDYKKVNEIYGSYFKNHKPARSTVQVAALPLGARVEIEVIGVK
ncbi:reactive intermediate/imine deaminase [Candidatus Roizmanbacteria bacterium RIFCSPLOWO2_01_FULL_38_12]|uniref:Reactive intermediate/imine deaminase n=1 Tax=Candidatus Roizmanbacteria bacterium RIFCSPLOWO2_01_FULL_38_12 TaxID=1802061 RepID=A0A1F7IRA9_9BACT|nr:MAG: reactive intermediate/imine deaminase [Candidatus Roizmanbacteria bacterium RIFCSPHIGHO2_01_FULL_38_15]OGK35414.1 MAG: reactive intermediate/imine deaminase [Candidatus Roizmanbacteria bacterium RIFCSPHIGHO2_12_FULL_38_13]OGK45890.1 MAG: reactive intermediate/imine deaminase [Candidatus Roizmanbacteria bacterium RIFCSPLOWO2_01_FULL_38_12]